MPLRVASTTPEPGNLGLPPWMGLGVGLDRVGAAETKATCPKARLLRVLEDCLEVLFRQAPHRRNPRKSQRRMTKPNNCVVLA